MLYLSYMANKRILILRMAGIGDVLLTTPAVRAIRKKFPKHDIDYITSEAGSLALKENKNINNIIVYKEKLKRNYILFKLPFITNYYFQKEFFQKLWYTEYDYIFDFESNKRSAFMSRKIKAVNKAAFQQSGKKKYINQYYSILHQPEKGIYQVDRYLGLIKKAGIPLKPFCNSGFFFSESNHPR